MSILRDRLGALRQLHGPHEFLLFGRLCLFAASIPLLVKLPLPRQAALLRRSRPTSKAPKVAIERLDKLMSLAPRFARPLVRTGCLTRGITLLWFLRRAGVEVELCFGLDARPHADVDGHCWLTLDGEPFLERTDPRPRFAELYRLPDPPAAAALW